ncbi:MAG: DNA-binding LytR/AlgR family response regulator [Cyclobacteriaceae bacterium]|jgi:DNA-binding LytR/AlgR family response regulator
MKINCIIVDDEPLSQEVIERFVKYFSNLNLVAKCNDAFEAMEVLKNEVVDLIFLDINMPKLSGMSFAKSLTKPPQIIFITAYPQYAVEGFEVDAVDYLLKPFSTERFINAVNKAVEKIESESRNTGGNEDKYFIVKSDKKLHRIAYSDISYFKAIGDFVKVFTSDGVLIASENLKDIETKLITVDFIRIHKTYLVPLAKLQYIEGNQAKVGDQMLPIGLTYKVKLIEKFKR